MWAVCGEDLSMAEGDYGIELPITIKGTTLTARDAIQITIKNRMNGNVVLEKTYDNITNNTVNLELTEEESSLFSVGSYVYSLDWFQDGNFMCNIIPAAAFKVVDKA